MRLPDTHKSILSSTVPYIFYTYFRHDEKGKLECITFSNHGRDSYLNLPVEQIKPFYRALKTYNDLLYDPENVVQIKLKEGKNL